MTTLKNILGSFASVAVLAGGFTVASVAMSPAVYAQAGSSKAIVDAAIAKGEVGEQINGYLGVVAGASPSKKVRASMADINIQRKAVYTRLSAAQNVQPSIVATLTGEKQLKKAASGTYVKDNSGAWKKK